MKRFLIVGCLLSMLASLLWGQDTQSASEEDKGDTHDLAKKSQNPVGDLISVPFKFDINFNTGPHNRVQYVGLAQPVYPVNLGQFNLINRLTIPIIDQPTGRHGGTFGLGDINYQAFFSPAKPGKIIWGLGPSITFPTGTDDVLGTDKWSAGPSFVTLTMSGHWVFGFLTSNMWSFAGDSDREDVNMFSFQYFTNYNLPKGWYIKSSPTITADWEADSDDRWTVPVGAGFGRLFKMGKLPVKADIQAIYNLERPDNANNWTLELSVTLLFPK